MDNNQNNRPFFTIRSRENSLENNNRRYGSEENRPNKNRFSVVGGRTLESLESTSSQLQTKSIISDEELDEVGSYQDAGNPKANEEFSQIRAEENNIPETNDLVKKFKFLEQKLGTKPVAEFYEEVRGNRPGNSQEGKPAA